MAKEGVYYFILNESAIKLLEFDAERAVGSKVLMNGRSGIIKGVVKDFHFRPLHHKISPLVMFSEKDWSYYFALVRLSDIQPVSLQQLAEQWTKLAPDVPFTYTFLDDQYNKMYQSEARLGNIFGVFSTLGILIACLGLLGLISYSAVQRAKEIGVRKVLGASVLSIVRLMVNDFGKLVILAFILAAPVSYVVMNGWLEDFQYRTPIGFGPVVGAFAISFIIALSVVSFQVVKAALADPVTVLKNE